MTLFTLVRRSLAQHAVSIGVTAIALGLAAGLMMSVWTIRTQAHAAFTQMNGGFDAVLGARGSKVQLVLSSLFHLDASSGNIKQEDFERIARHPAVKAAVPIAVGDNLGGFRIVGTTPQLFEVEYRPGFVPKFSQGRIWQGDAHEAVLGSVVAEQLRMRTGSTFHPSHGVADSGGHDHEHEYTVVGVLAPTASPLDRVVWIPLSGVQHMDGHAENAQDEVSAVLLQLRAASAGFMLDLQYNRQDTRLTFAYPVAAIVGELFGRLAWFDRVLQVVAYLVALVSGATVFVALYATMLSRRRDLALLRALGATRLALFRFILLEAGTIGALGAVAGYAFYAVICVVAATLIQRQTGVVIHPWTPQIVWAVVPAAMIGLSCIAGIIPAVRAHRVSVADGLVSES